MATDVYAELNVVHVAVHDRGQLAAYTARDTSERRLLERELVAKHTALFTAYADLERAHAQLSETKRELEDRNREIAMLAWRAAMGELVAGIAHHLNNPVGALASTLRRLGTVVTRVPDEPRAELERLLGARRRDRAPDRDQRRGDRARVEVECREARAPAICRPSWPRCCRRSSASSTRSPRRNGHEARTHPRRRR